MIVIPTWPSIRYLQPFSMLARRAYRSYWKQWLCCLQTIMVVWRIPVLLICYHKVHTSKVHTSTNVPTYSQPQNLGPLLVCLARMSLWSRCWGAWHGMWLPCDIMTIVCCIRTATLEKNSHALLI